MRYHSWLKSTWHTLTGMPKCVLCHETAHTFGLCAGCLNDLQTLRRHSTHICPLCPRFSVNAQICGHCQRHPPPTVRLFAAYDYAPPIKQILHAFKHLRQPHFSKPLAGLLLAHCPPWLSSTRFDMVLPMPLSRQRLHERGFNQSRLLAEPVAKHLAVPLLDNNAVLRQHRPPQSTLSGADRRRNVRGIFCIKADVKNRNVLLIDDVVTTGATIAELAQSLTRAGTAGVWAWTLTHPK